MYTKESHIGWVKRPLSIKFNSLKENEEEVTEIKHFLSCAHLISFLYGQSIIQWSYACTLRDQNFMLTLMYLETVL